MKKALVFLICLLGFNHAYADSSIICHSAYIILNGANKESTPGPDLKSAVKSDGTSFANIDDVTTNLTYSVSLNGGIGSIGLSIGNNKTAAASFGDLSSDGKTLRLIFADQFLKTQAIIDINCLRQ